MKRSQETNSSLLDFPKNLKRSLPLSHVYQLLEPGPVVLVTTAHKIHMNVMTLSWQTMMEFVPPLVGFVLSNRNYSFDLLRASKECVINIPDVHLASQVVRSGNSSGEKINKFSHCDLTPTSAGIVHAPLIKECFAHLECTVVDQRLVNKYNFFVVQVIKAWINKEHQDWQTIHHRGNGIFAVDGTIIKLPSRKK